jgi:hypothetical protein
LAGFLRALLADRLADFLAAFLDDFFAAFFAPRLAAALGFARLARFALFTAGRREGSSDLA